MVTSLYVSHHADSLPRNDCYAVFFPDRWVAIFICHDRALPAQHRLPGIAWATFSPLPVVWKKNVATRDCCDNQAWGWAAYSSAVNSVSVVAFWVSDSFLQTRTWRQHHLGVEIWYLQPCLRDLYFFHKISQYLEILCVHGDLRVVEEQADAQVNCGCTLQLF